MIIIALRGQRNGERVMSDDKLGTLEKVDIRSIWPSEARDFTPWLAQEENIAILSEAIGTELEVEGTEVAAGPFYADILARDTATGDYVIIENQFGRTDHDHLGKALTYAATLDASAVVWIAPAFADEHKKALDWLNDNSTDDLSFFGVQPELWSIDNSRPALRFNVVSGPRVTVRKAMLQKGELTDTKKLQLEWWTFFREKLLAAKAAPSARAPRAQYWYNVALGRSGIHISNIANVSNKKIGVRVYLREKANGVAALEQLRESKDEIEATVGCSLLWDANPSARDKIIAVYHVADISQKDRWPEFCEWMVDMNARFRKAFSERVKRLDLDEPQGEEEDGE